MDAVVDNAKHYKEVQQDEVDYMPFSSQMHIIDEGKQCVQT